MDHQKIFATNLFVIDDFCKDSTDSMKKYISDLWTNRKYETNWQTKSADLHKQKEFKYFSDLVLTTSKDIIKELD